MILQNRLKFEKQMLEKLRLKNIVSNFVYKKARKLKLKNKVTI